MSTETKDTGISADVLADTQLAAECVAAGKPIPAEVARRVQAHAERIRQQLHQPRGTRDIAVQIIREMRGPLDDEQARELTISQREVLRSRVRPWRLRDPETGEEYVLLPVAEYARLKAGTNTAELKPAS